MRVLREGDAVIPTWAASGPPLIAFLFVVVVFRAQGTYWLGRAAARGALAASGRTGVPGAIARWFEGPVPRRGAALLDRWGLLIIPLCFLTVGVQTAVNAGAGIVRMKWRTYTIAMIPGCIAWAFLYGLGMLAVWTAAVSAVAGSTPGRIVIALLLGALVLLLIRRSRARSADAVRPERAPIAETPARSGAFEPARD